MNTTQETSVVAAFDFDGTITYGDTLFYFLLYTHGFFRTLGKLFFQIPHFVSFLIGVTTRQKAKESVVKAFYAGMPIDMIREMGENFAKEALNKHVRPEALKRLQWHLRKGHRCVLISASLDVYLIPWAKLVGIHDVISSKLETNSEGIITGNLSGLNCWGPEKTEKLFALLGPKKYRLYAYGDSKGDKELLASADYPFYRKMPKSSLEEGQ